MRNKCLLFIAVAFCSLMALPLYAQVQISGVVTDAANGDTPLQSASAWTMIPAESDITDAIETISNDQIVNTQIVNGTFDLLGRPLSQPLTGMPYIHNGQLILTR